MATGKNYKVFISSTGLSGGTMTELEYQGDLTINPGKTNETTAFKNGTLAAQGNDGFSAAFDIGVVEPLATAQQYLWTQFTNGGNSYMQFKSATTGSIMFAGPVMVAVTQISEPTKGIVNWTIQVNENGTVASSTV